MGISVFPTGGGEFVINDFVIDMNDTTNNVAELASSKEAGSYTVTLASGDTSFDIYALDSDGNSVGYTNDASLVCSSDFTTVVVLGVASSEVLTFSFAGGVSNAATEGDAPGAGAYLESISPSDLPAIDDTANVIGGNFATDVEIYFESGTVSTEAKNVVRSDSTALVVTRPDALDPALDPWDVKAINPGVTPPTGSNAHILSGTVDAGAVPVFSTTSPLPLGTALQAYAATVVATDADGDVTYSVTAGSLPTGLSLNGATGVISGTPSTGSETFTVQALDDGGNSNTREFDLPVALATGGDISLEGNFIVHTFDASSDFTPLTTITDAEYIILAGGGGGGNSFGGGGGGGGLLSSITGFASGSATTALAPVTVNAQTHTVTVGAGGAAGADGSDSSLGAIGTAIGGGEGGNRNHSAPDADGGSGGGAGDNTGNFNTGGSGTTGQGFSGGNSGGGNVDGGAGGGGTSSAGQETNGNAQGGDGTSNFLDERGWGAGGGGGFNGNTTRNGGGSDGNDQTTYAGNASTGGNSGVANFGGGGGGATNGNAGAGGSGKIVIRYV